MIQNKEQAQSVLITAVKIAQSKGAYTLEEAELIHEATKILKPVPFEKEEKYMV